MNKNQVILITGVYGYIGSQLFIHLRKKYKNLYGIGRKKISFKKFKNCLDSKITSKSLSKLRIKPQIIIHCSGSGSVRESEKNKKKDFYDNVKSLKVLLKFFNKNKYHIIYLSSAAVYGETTKSKINLNPISTYGKNKLLAENLIKSEKSKNFSYTILRIFSLFGVGLRKQLLWDTCKKIKNKKFKYYGTGNELRSWISIKKLIKYIEITLKREKINKIEDISGNFSIKNKIVINKIHELMKSKKKPIFNKENRKGDPVNLVPNSLYKNKIQFKKKDFYRDLKEYINWFNEI